MSLESTALSLWVELGSESSKVPAVLQRSDPASSLIGRASDPSGGGSALRDAPRAGDHQEVRKIMQLPNPRRPARPRRGDMARASIARSGRTTQATRARPRSLRG